MENKIITIFSQRLAGYLMLNKFVLISMRPDINGSGRNLFFFNDSEEIQEKIRQYKNSKI